MGRRPGRRWALALVIAGALLAGGYWLAQRSVRGGAAGADASGVQGPQTPTASVAVLPFLDLSDTKDQQYLADGLAEELIERLATAPRLHVTARSSSFYFKGRQATVAEIAKTLGVSYLLEGSVRKAGDTLRITTHLVRAEDGYDLWSETYDRPLADVLKIEDEIASNVVFAFKMSVLVPQPLTTSADAHDEYLRAHLLMNNATASDYGAAETHLRTALKLDPQFAEAWAWLAMETIWKLDGIAPSPTPGAWVSARTAASRALELKPSLALTHRAKGIVLRSCDRDLSGAGAEFNRALELQPNDPLVLMSQALLAMDTGRVDTAVELASRATAVDPLNPWTFSTLCYLNLDAGHPTEAEASCRKALVINPSVPAVHRNLAIALLTNQKPADALAETLREPDLQRRLGFLPIVLDAAGRKSEAQRELKELQVRYGEQSDFWVALYYACRHDSDDAIQWLQRYVARYQELRPLRPYLQACLDNLEPDTRYQELKRQLKFAPRSE